MAEGEVSAAEAATDRTRTDSGNHLEDARRELREKEARIMARDFAVPGAPPHPVRSSPARPRSPRSLNSILPPLDPQIHEEPDIPLKHPARAGTAPVQRSSGGGVDDSPRANDTTRSLSTSDAPATNPGTDALHVLNQLSPRRYRDYLVDDRRGSRNDEGTGVKSGKTSEREADGKPGPSTNTSPPEDIELDTWKASQDQGLGA